MTYEEIEHDILSIENAKTKDIDKYNKTLIKKRADVSDLKEHVLEKQYLYRTYFQVSLGLMNTYEEQFEFIEENASLLRDWWHVDILTQFMKVPIDFSYAFTKAKEYVKSDLTFLRRWGYVLFLTGLQKDKDHTEEILSLIKNDGEYYVRMAEAWLIADLAVFNIDSVKKFMQTTDIDYSIAGRAIQKMCDSFRISSGDKEYMKSLRARWKSK